MKKNIIVISHAMHIGGAERALLGLLESFDYDKYNVDLFLMRHEGELLKFVPKEVNILPSNNSRYLAVPMLHLVKEKKYKLIYGRLKAKINAKLYSKLKHFSKSSEVELLYSHKYTHKYLEPINKDKCYDLAISFLTPHYISYKKINAKKKIAWIHTDYSTIEIDVKNEEKMWGKFDKIVSISDAVTDAFLKKLPSLKDKIIRIDNIMSSDFILEQAKDKIDDMPNEEGVIKLLSIGRYCHAKNFDNVPEICKYLVDSGLNVKWYLIGFGSDENLIKEKIKEFNMSNNVILLGKKVNPYPYIKQCDFYLQPSRYEGKAVSVIEAQILHKPVIITNFPTARNQIQEGVDGFIVPLNNQQCAKEIVDLIVGGKIFSIIKNLEKINYSNNSEINKIYELIK